MARRLGQFFVFCFAALQLSACPCGCLEHNGWFVLYEDLLFGNETIADSSEEDEAHQTSQISLSSCGHSHSHALKETPTAYAAGCHECEHGHCVNVYIRGTVSGLLSNGSLIGGNMSLPAAMSTADSTCIADARNASHSCARFSSVSPGAIAPPVCALHQVFLI